MAKLKLEDRIASLEKALLGPSPTNASQLSNEERVGWLEEIIAPSSLSAATMAQFALQQGWSHGFNEEINGVMNNFFEEKDQISYNSQDVIQALQEVGLEQSEVEKLIDAFREADLYECVLTKFATNQRN